MIPRARLSSPNAYVLLVCSKFHFCGAFVVERSNIWDSYYITLAPFAI